MTKYFGIPFARDGDKTAIPVTVQPGGEISYPEGWTADYEAEQGVDPNAKDVDRQKENQFKFDISEAMKEVQERGILPYRADVDYPVDAVVIASDSSQYIAIAANGPATSVVDPVGNPGTWANDILTVADIGDTVQAFDADTAKLDVVQEFTADQTFNEVTETQYSLTGTIIDPANGTLQYKTLGANTTLTESMEDGQSVTLMLADGSFFTATWPSIQWVGGSAPTLPTSGFAVIELWQINGVLYGMHSGDV